MIATAMHREPLLVDTDPALGVPGRDVDDALAIHWLHVQGWPLAALTTTFGNAKGARTHTEALRLGERFGLTVHRGADRPGHADTAARDALVAHSGEVLALGPLTNIAAALAAGARWSRLTVLGGTVRPPPNLRYLRMTELNLALDPVATAQVLPHVDELVLMRPCRQVHFTGQQVACLPDWMRPDVEAWLRLAPLMTGRRAFHPWDLVAAMTLTHPHLYAREPHAVAPMSGRLARGHVRLGAPTENGAMGVVKAVDGAGLIRTWERGVSR